MGQIDLRDLGSALIYLGYLAGALAAIAVVVHRVVVRPLRRWNRQQIQGAIGDVLAEIRAVQQPLAEVHAEVKPNHGSSIKDAVARIEQQQHELAQRLTDHLTNHPGRT